MVDGRWSVVGEWLGRKGRACAPFCLTPAPLPAGEGGGYRFGGGLPESLQAAARRGVRPGRRRGGWVSSWRGSRSRSLRARPREVSLIAVRLAAILPANRRLAARGRGGVGPAAREGARAGRGRGGGSGGRGRR